MRRSMIAVVAAVSLVMGSYVFAADIDNMTLEELKTAYTELESEKESETPENKMINDS